MMYEFLKNMYIFKYHKNMATGNDLRSRASLLQEKQLHHLQKLKKIHSTTKLIEYPQDVNENSEQVCSFCKNVTQNQTEEFEIIDSTEIL